MPDTKLCPRCGAKNPRLAAKCWLCNDPFATAADAALAGAIGRPAPAADAADRTAYSFSLSTLLLVITLVAVVFGMLSVAPGLGIVLAILALPVLVRTAGVVRHRKATGLSTPAAKRALLFVTSLGVALLMVTVIGIAGIATFGGIYCFATLHGPGWSGMGQTGLLIAIFSSPILICAIVIVWKWAKARWRRDTQEP